MMFPTLNLDWRQCQGSVWCSFEHLDLSKVNGEGIYIIWSEGIKDRAVYVGQGNVSDRLSDHRQDKDILAYGGCGKLLVTWADVPACQRDAVERRLADEYEPLVGECHPDVYPINVNLPW